MPLARPIFLTGFMATGKSTLARAIAARANLPFVDLDEAIETNTGSTIEQLFAQHGEGRFRAIERAMLEVELDNPSPRVVALGGGALLDREIRLRALERTTVICLRCRPETICARVDQSTHRPLLAVPDREAAIERLLSARASTYAEAHATIDTDDPPLEQLVDRALDIASHDDLLVAAGERSCLVRVASDLSSLESLLAPLAPTGLIAFTDRNVAPHVSPTLSPLLARHRSTLEVLDPGESSKQVQTLSRCWTALDTWQIDRAGVVLAAGGGVVSDLAGLAAGTWMRGVRWAVLPTTLLSMVDASIGGKTAIDFGQAKNTVGVFHQPSFVLSAVGLCRSEPQRSFTSGLVELIKTALIGDAALLDRVEQLGVSLLARDPAVLRPLVRAAAAVKVGIVSRDERESGLRMLLNLGHTFGHGVEAAFGYHRYFHGEAVGIGLVAALRVGVALGITPADLPGRIKALLTTLGLPTEVTPDELEPALALLGSDKKRRGSSVRYVLVEAPGKALVEPIDLQRLRAMLREQAG